MPPAKHPAALARTNWKARRRDASTLRAWERIHAGGRFTGVRLQQKRDRAGERQEKEERREDAGRHRHRTQYISTPRRNAYLGVPHRRYPVDAKGSPEAWGSPIVGTVKRETEARRSADWSDMNVLDGRRDRSEWVARRDGVSRSVGKKVGKNDLHPSPLRKNKGRGEVHGHDSVGRVKTPCGGKLPAAGANEDIIHL